MADPRLNAGVLIGGSVRGTDQKRLAAQNGQWSVPRTQR